MTVQLIKKLTLPSLGIWVTPFIVSMFFYDRSGTMMANFWVFKITMMVSATLAALFFLRTFFKHNPKETVLNTALVIFLFQVVLDIIVLIALFKMPIQDYILTVLPVYVVLIPLTTYFLKKKA